MRRPVHEGHGPLAYPLLVPGIRPLLRIPAVVLPGPPRHLRFLASLQPQVFEAAAPCLEPFHAFRSPLELRHCSPWPDGPGTLPPSCLPPSPSPCCTPALHGPPLPPENPVHAEFFA